MHAGSVHSHLVNVGTNHGIGITLSAIVIANHAGVIGNFLEGVNIPVKQAQAGLQLSRGIHGNTTERNITHLVAGALIDVNTHGKALGTGATVIKILHLGDGSAQVAVVAVQAYYLLEVVLHTLTINTAGFGEPSKESALLRLHHLAELGVIKLPVTDKLNVIHGNTATLINVEHHIAVPLTCRTDVAPAHLHIRVISLVVHLDDLRTGLSQ